MANPDAVRTEVIDHVILDHISVTWGIDGVHDFAGGNFTLQWSMYGESLNRSLHHDDHPHAMLASFRCLILCCALNCFLTRTFLFKNKGNLD